MADHLENADTGPTKSGPHLLAGAIELTPEAHAILTKQVNRKIVWGYKVTKAVFQTLACTPLLISAFFIFVAVASGVRDIDWLRLIAFVLAPIVLSALLFRLVKKY